MEEKSDFKTNVYYEFIFKRGNISETLSKFNNEKELFLQGSFKKEELFNNYLKVIVE